MAENDALSFLDESEGEVPEAERETAAPQEQQAEGEALEAEPDANAEGVTEGEPPAPAPEQSMVPIKALLDDREKRQAAEARAKAAEERLRVLEQQQRPQEPQQPPDMFQDPQAYTSYVQQQVQQQQIAAKLEMSRFYAEREFGKEAVAEVIEYFNEKPELSHQFLSKPSPIHAAKEFVDSQKALAEIGNDPAAYRERVKQELLAELNQSGGVSQQSPQRPGAPPSMARAQSVKGASQSPGSAFEQAFPN